MIKYLQQQVQPTMLLVLMVSIILMTGLAGYLYVLKHTIIDYKQAQQTIQILKDEISTGVSLPEQITASQKTVVELQQKLYGLTPELPLHQKIAFVIGRLDAISAQHKVTLQSVKPGEVTTIFMFRELPFNIEINGSYTRLFAWLQQVEQDLGPIVVKDFAIQPEPIEGSVTVTLSLVSYLIGPEEE
ncbi:MAG: type 4a pilus biogenesis protein PilO [Methylococcales bacterium]